MTVESIATAAYIVAFLLFILSLAGLSKHESAGQGVVFGIAGMVIALACLGVSHYVMGLTSVLADNVANIVGLVLGTVFRFWLYKVWVYHPERTGSEPVATDVAHEGRALDSTG